MGCLACGAATPRGAVKAVCTECLAPRIGRAQTRQEALYDVLRHDVQALEVRARLAWVRALGEALPLEEAERRWLALGPMARAALRAQALEGARVTAGVALPPEAPGPLRIVP